VYNLYVKDIEAITGRKWDYSQLQEATQNMGSRVYVVETDEILEQILLFEGFKYMKGEGCVTVSLTRAGRSYILDLKNRFNRAQLQSALLLRSKFAKRLYAFSCQSDTASSVTLTVSGLKEQLGLRDPNGKRKEQFTNLFAFKTKVLEVAKEQINAHTDISFDYAFHKHGRTFDQITLYFGMAKEFLKTIDFNEPLDDQKIHADD